jgi:hypothetical protein
MVVRQEVAKWKKKMIEKSILSLKIQRNERAL